MPESINQWATEYLGSIFLSLALWTVGAAIVGFIAGVVLFFFLRLVRIYRFKFQLGGLVAFLLFVYTVGITTVALGFIGLFESAKRQSETLVSDPENQEMIGQFSGALTSRGAAIAYAYGEGVQSTGNEDPDFAALLKEVQAFDKGEWGIDISKSDAAFDSISDEAIQRNYEKLYELVFKNTAENESDLRNSIKPVLDWFIKPEDLNAQKILSPIRSTLSAIETNRGSQSQSDPVYSKEIKQYTGEKTADFIQTNLTFWIRSQQVFAGIVVIIALAVPVLIIVVLKIVSRSSSKTPPPLSA